MSYPVQNISKPYGISIIDWKIALKKAQLVKEEFENGKPWQNDLFVNSKEFFQLISINEERLMIGGKATLKFGNNKNITNWVKQLKEEAISAIETQNFKLAEQKLATWRLIQPTNSEMQLMLGLVYFKQANNNMAWRTLTRLINENPRFEKAFFLRAAVNNKVGKNEDALEDINLFLKLNSEDVSGILLKEKILISLDKSSVAINLLNEAYKNSPRFILGKNLIELLLSEKRIKEAKQVFKSLSTTKEQSASKLFQLALLAKKLRLESDFWKFLFFAKEKQHIKAQELWMQITIKKNSIAA